MPALLFNRAWSVDILPPGQTRGVRYTNQGLAPNNLRLQFEAERTLQSNANKAKIKLTNMTPSNRSNIVQGSTVVLRAGYLSNFDVIFLGFVRNISSTQSGPDVVTEMECGDGEPYLTYGFVNLTYASTVTLAQILQDVAKSLNVSLGGQVYAASGVKVQGIPDVSFPRYTLHGKTKKALDQLLKPRGLLWSIQSGTLLIQNAKYVLNLVAEVLSPGTGMVETPTRTVTGVTVSSLLNPRLVPGVAIQILSSNQAANGKFRAIKCSYTGDSEGSDWTVKIEGQALLGPLAAVPITQKKNDFRHAIVDSSDEADADEVEE